MLISLVRFSTLHRLNVHIKWLGVPLPIQIGKSVWCWIAIIFVLANFLIYYTLCHRVHFYSGVYLEVCTFITSFKCFNYTSNIFNLLYWHSKKKIQCRVKWWQYHSNSSTELFSNNLRHETVNSIYWNFIVEQDLGYSINSD